MSKLLLIDDDRAMRRLVEAALAGSQIEVIAAGSGREGLELLALKPDVILLDVILPDTTGLDLAREIQARDCRAPIVFMTGHGNSQTAIEAMKLGAYDYLLKPVDLVQLRATIQRAHEIRRLMAASRTTGIAEDAAAENVPAPEAIIGNCARMQDVFKAIGRVAARDVAVLIRGESGTGKELVARAIARHGPRAEKPFLAVNCAAIPDTLLESELFGHERGSFTGADERRLGKFEHCHTGTIFMDEVGDMSPLLQSKILRLLQEQRFERVGGTETVHTDVRVIAATHRDLKQLAARGEFREDLYYRLNGFTIELPPLRERGADVPLLLEHCRARFNRELSKRINAISPEALELLTTYSWPGNVRELEAVMRQAMLQAVGNVILPEFLPDVVRRAEGKPPPGIARTDASCDVTAIVERGLERGAIDLHATTMDSVEAYLLRRVLRHTRGNQSEAARILGITRGSLRNKIHHFGIALRPTIESELNAGTHAPAGRNVGQATNGRVHAPDDPLA